MTKEEIINFYIEDTKSHNPDEVMCFIAGYREDNGKDYYTWGEFLDALTTQSGYVWENTAKNIVDITFNHPEMQVLLTKKIGREQVAMDKHVNVNAPITSESISSAIRSFKDINPTWVGNIVTNAAVASKLQTMKGYCGIDNSYVIPGEIYKIGTYHEDDVYVDPYMSWDDTRIIFIV